MTRQAELLNIVDKLPPKYFGEIIDFAGYLQYKARQEVKPLSGTCKNLTVQEAMDIPLSSDDLLAMRQQERELENRLDGAAFN